MPAQSSLRETRRVSVSFVSVFSFSAKLIRRPTTVTEHLPVTSRKSKTPDHSLLPIRCEQDCSSGRCGLGEKDSQSFKVVPGVVEVFLANGAVFRFRQCTVSLLHPFLCDFYQCIADLGDLVRPNEACSIVVASVERLPSKNCVGEREWARFVYELPVRQGTMDCIPCLVGLERPLVVFEISLFEILSDECD